MTVSYIDSDVLLHRCYLIYKSYWSIAKKIFTSIWIDATGLFHCVLFAILYIFGQIKVLELDNKPSFTHNLNFHFLVQAVECCPTFSQSFQNRARSFRPTVVQTSATCLQFWVYTRANVPLVSGKLDLHFYTCSV